MTGIGFGIARETNRTWLKWLAPIGGYFCAMILHCIWNTAATISGFLMILMLPLWFLFVAAFIGILIWLVVRKGRIIREHLQDEVLLGNLTREELDARLLAVRRAARARSAGAARRGGASCGRGRGSGSASGTRGGRWQGRKRTVSADWIVPLRQELFELRSEIPRAWDARLPHAAGVASTRTGRAGPGATRRATRQPVSPRSVPPGWKQ